MNIGQLKKILKVAARQYSEAGNADVARSLSNVAANLLKDNESETVAAFVRRVEKARSPPAPKAKQPRKRK